MESEIEFKHSRLRGGIDWNRWFSASSTRNHVLKDPLLDWLSMYHELLEKKSPSLRNEIVASRGVSHHPTNFVSFIMSQGQKFEKHLINYLFRKLPEGWMVDIGGELNARSNEKFNETIKAMKNGVRVIHSGVLRNYYTKTYGIPDLLIRSDVFGEIFEVSPIPAEYENKRASLLDTPFHYRVVDIKFCTLKLKCNGIHLLNCGSIPAYKSQLYLYNEALATIQGYNPNVAYVLGRRWHYTSKRIKYEGDGALDRLGVIDYDEVDREYVKLTKEALRWLSNLRWRGSRWSPTIHPSKRKKELFPNMSNGMDGKWHDLKRKLADQDGEISNVWQLGVKHRKVAHRQGVYSWRDSRLNSELLEMGGRKIPLVVNKMLEINRGSDLFSPHRIETEMLGWRDNTETTVEVFVDFETVNDIFTDFSTIPQAERRAMIFMIGLGRYTSQGTWVYKSWTVDSLTQSEEKKVCLEFQRYLHRLAQHREVDVEDIKVWHYSHAEKSWWNQTQKKNSELHVLLWCDLLELFRYEPIVIKGCLGFGLKEIATKMHEHSMIPVKWNPEEHSSCLDGASAMVAAYRAQKDCDERGTLLPTHTLIKEMLKYNEMDCRVVGEILKYLRDHH